MGCSFFFSRKTASAAKNKVEGLTPTLLDPHINLGWLIGMLI